MVRWDFEVRSPTIWEAMRTSSLVTWLECGQHLVQGSRTAVLPFTKGELQWHSYERVCASRGNVRGFLEEK